MEKEPNTITIDIDILAERAAGLADILMAGKDVINTGYGKKKHHGVMDLILRKIVSDDDVSCFDYYHYPLEDYVIRGRAKRLSKKQG